MEAGNNLQVRGRGFGDGCGVADRGSGSGGTDAVEGLHSASFSGSLKVSLVGARWEDRGGGEVDRARVAGHVGERPCVFEKDPGEKESVRVGGKPAATLEGGARQAGMAQRGVVYLAEGSPGERRNAADGPGMLVDEGVEGSQHVAGRVFKGDVACIPVAVGAGGLGFCYECAQGGLRCLWAWGNAVRFPRPSSSSS